MREIKFLVISGDKIVGEERLTGNGWEWTYYALNPDSGKRWISGVMDIQNGSKKIERAQFSGLHDKNGKEIYEGDIVEFLDAKVHNSESGMDCEEFINRGVVEWDDEELRHTVSNRESVDLEELWSDPNLKVIGNIYEHPHLLGDNEIL